MNDQVDRKIDYWKRELIDLSRRNRLIYFRETKSSTAKIIRPSAREIFDWLVINEKPLIFGKTNEGLAETSLNMSQSPQNAATEGEGKKELKPGYVITPLDDERLNVILNNLRLKSRTALEEQGVNILFLAFGFLEWYESAASDEKILSPLILVPVELKRESVTRPYKLYLLDDEIVLNPALSQKLTVHISLPILSEDFTEQTLVETLAAVKELIRNVPRWKLSDDVYLSVFSFIKLIMYKDLEDNVQIAKENPFVAALGGDKSRLLPPSADIPTVEELDEKILPIDTFEVLDADSSQQLVIVSAKHGISFVLHGPPGTGKSQSIVNIIAESLASGKTVLFVSEKMAALEVVQKRLNECGLGEFCLEIHSHKAKKRAVIDLLGKSLETRQALAFGRVEEQLEQLGELRRELNAYVRALHTPRTELRLSAYRVHGELAKLIHAKELEFSLPDVWNISSKGLAQIGSLLSKLESFPQVLEDYRDHPWQGTILSVWSFPLERDLRAHLQKLMALLDESIKASRQLAAACALREPKTLREFFDLTDLTSRFRCSIFRLDLHAMVERFQHKYSSIFRYIYLGFWRDMRLVKREARTPQGLGHREALNALQFAAMLQNKLSREGEESQSTNAGEETVDVEEGIINSCIDLSRDIKLELDFLSTIFPLDDLEFDGRGIIDSDVDALAEWIGFLADNVGRLKEWLDFQLVVRECQEAGLEQFVRSALEARLSAQDLKPAFYRRFYQLWLDRVYVVDPVLASFRSEYQNKQIEAFRELDKDQLRIARRRLIHKLVEQRPETQWATAPTSEISILRREVLKKRRNKPLRKLFSEIPDLLLKLKPCLLMSPLSVSQFLDPKIFRFDLIIFDEASQIKPEDAIPAIMRGDQIVIAGDNKQLPPTIFFTSLGVEEFEPEAEEEAEEKSLESILDECVGIGLPAVPLRWHYRSRVEDLIAFSNYHFYDNGLNTFPGNLHLDELGIEFVYVPDGVYDRGKSKRNLVEAKRVVDLIFEHFAKHPQRSLGVVAFSEAQQKAILDEIEVRLKERPDLEVLFEEQKEERFFVKNLENVQGDERDEMFFSVGYGKDATGKMYMSFGPLNTENGERRLNVAITRARYHVKVVSSILPSDIDLTRAQSRGAGLLRSYLEYAMRGPEVLRIPGPEFGIEETESPFEEAVYKALVDRGYEVKRQVGVSGYRIDLAILDPEDPGGFILGIECDGAMYHSAKTARDRDRLRQQILEGLGWKIHRIWSRDWIADPKREIAKIQQKVKQLSREKKSREYHHQREKDKPIDSDTAKDRTTAAINSESPNAPVASPKLHDFPPGVKLYEVAKLGWLGDPQDFYRSSNLELLEALVKVVKIEGPIHISLAAQRIAEAFGLKRVGSNILGRIELVANLGARNTRLRIQHEFLWPVRKRVVSVRVPYGEIGLRDVQLIALEEVAEGAYICVRNNLSLTRNDLVRETARLFGFNRTGEKVRRHINKAIEHLLSTGKIVLEEGRMKIEE